MIGSCATKGHPCNVLNVGQKCCETIKNYNKLTCVPDIKHWQEGAIFPPGYCLPIESPETKRKILR